MSRNNYTGECSVPHQRGRKQNLKCKRLSTKRTRVLPIDVDGMLLKRTAKSVRLDTDPCLTFKKYTK